MKALLPLLVAIFGATIYNIGAKQVPSGLNPMHFLVVVYLLATLISFGLGFSFSGRQPLLVGLQKSGVTLALLALGIVCIELGYILAYRAGGMVSLVPIMISSGTLLIMLPLGRLLFGQQPSLRALLGAAFCPVGLALMVWKK